VITRYFGGTKLGTGGLVKAYSESARTAVEGVKKSRKVQYHTARLGLDYGLYNPVLRALKEHECLIDSEDFAGSVTILVAIPAAKYELLEATLQELSNGALVPEQVAQGQTRRIPL
jgi:putative IMPACT (imprinted ancient) family translation regulator